MVIQGGAWPSPRNALLRRRRRPQTPTQAIVTPQVVVESDRMAGGATKAPLVWCREYHGLLPDLATRH